MRRLVVFDAYPYDIGGAHRLIKRLDELLPPLGWSVRAVLPAAGPAVDYLRDGGVETDVLEAPGALLHYGGSTKGPRAFGAVTALPRYWAHCRRDFRATADVVVANDPRGLFLAGPAARTAGVPLLWWLHAEPAQLRKVLRPLSMLADFAIASSAPLFELSARKGEVVAPPVDVPAAVRTRRTRPPVVASIARIHPQKGIDVLVEASRRLHEKGVDHTVVVAGSGRGDDAERDLRRLISRHQLDDTFTIAGSLPDVSHLLDRATVYVQPSRSLEGFGMAALEAMAHGLPVIATDVGGLRELVTDVGVLVPVDDAAALAAELGALLGDPARRKQLGTAGRARAASYSPEQWARQMAAVLDRMAPVRT